MTGWPGPWRHRTADGVELVGHTAGAGPVTAVLLHGGASNHRWWTPVARLLAGWQQVLWWDQRGHGRSGHGGDCTLDTLAADTLDVLDRLDGRPVVLAGHSAGATVAIRVAAARRVTVAGVVCVDGGLYDPHILHGPTWTRACPRMLGGPTGPTTVDVLRAWLPTAGLPPDALDAVLGNYHPADDTGLLRPCTPPAVARQLAHSVWYHRLAADAAALTCPVLMLVANDGDPDALALRINSLATVTRQMAAGRVGTWVVRGGHHLPLQHPATVAAAVARLTEPARRPPIREAARAAG